MAKILYKIIILLYTIWVKIKWSKFNPWATAVLNSAYQRYKLTSLYDLRLDFAKKLYESGYLINKSIENFIVDIFIDSGEVFFFIKQLTWKDKLKIFVIPFSIDGPFKLGGR